DRLAQIGIVSGDNCTVLQSNLRTRQAIQERAAGTAVTGVTGITGQAGEQGFTHLLGRIASVSTKPLLIITLYNDDNLTDDSGVRRDTILVTEQVINSGADSGEVKVGVSSRHNILFYAEGRDKDRVDHVFRSHFQAD